MSLKVIIIFSLIAFVASKHEKGDGVEDKDDYEKSFKEFKKAHKKEYKDEAKAAKAFDHYSKNLDRVKKHNARKAAKLEDYEMEVYPFMDEDLDDVIKTLCGGKVPPEARSLPTIEKQPDPSEYPAGPSSVNFTNLCAPVVDQGRCGSCWSFGTIAFIETMYKKFPATSNWLIAPLSQQHLIDCDTSNKGCSGGWPMRALEFLKTDEVMRESKYPYKGVQGTCQSTTKRFTYSPITDNFQYYLNGNELHLKNILARIGPVIVGVSTNKNFMAYKSGIFSDPTCPTDCSLSHLVNHIVLLVGYGTDATTGKEFWILRNSWGSNWGEQGYMRMAKGIGNNCLTACYAMFSRLQNDLSIIQRT